MLTQAQCITFNPNLACKNMLLIFFFCPQLLPMWQKVFWHHKMFKQLIALPHDTQILLSSKLPWSPVFTLSNIRNFRVFFTPIVLKRWARTQKWVLKPFSVGQLLIHFKSKLSHFFIEIWIMICCLEVVVGPRNQNSWESKLYTLHY